MSLIAVAICLGLNLCINAAVGEDLAEGEQAFLPTWKLLKGDAKHQFVAGYLFGWRDAAKVTDIAIDYVRQNPQKAVEGLERIRGIYDMEGLSSDTVVRELDRFFSESNNKNSTLSQALTTVKARLGR